MENSLNMKVNNKYYSVLFFYLKMDNFFKQYIPAILHIEIFLTSATIMKSRPLILSIL